LVRKMAQAIVLQPLAEGSVAGVLSAALGKALRQQDEGMQLGHGVGLLSEALIEFEKARPHGPG
jgi:hypothetical protein